MAHTARDADGVRLADPDAVEDGEAFDDWLELDVAEEVGVRVEVNEGVLPTLVVEDGVRVALEDPDEL